jgi:hypothetical protein
MKDLKGLATGIGSLPHTDTDAALDLVFKHVPRIPFWPQLPKLNAREGMVAQFSENLPFIGMVEKGLAFSGCEGPDKDKTLESYYEHIIANDIDYFQISESYAAGLYKFCQRLEKQDLKDIVFLKGHTTGPFTFAAGLTDERGISLLHEPILMQAILKGLAMKAAWQINFLRKFRKKIVLFIDEPYLGCFGSAYTPLNREDVVNKLSEFTQSLRSEDVLLGVHCCGNTDWSIFTDVEAIRIISFDAFDYMGRMILYADHLKAFFSRQGILCWGIVPTQLFTGLETPEILIRRIKEGMHALVKKGLDENELLKGLLVSPGCGLGTFTTQKSEKIFHLLSEVSFLIRKYN